MKKSVFFSIILLSVILSYSNNETSTPKTSNDYDKSCHIIEQNHLESDFLGHKTIKGLLLNLKKPRFNDFCSSEVRCKFEGEDSWRNSHVPCGPPRCLIPICWFLCADCGILVKKM